MSLDRHHERIRTRGINPVVYWITRAVLQPFLMIWFRPSRIGREHIPGSGGVVLAANHKSFLDPFLIGLCLRRPIYFVAKRELFENRLIGWFLNCLGAFPVRRGESDEEMVATAQAVLARGDALVIFPEGTRVRDPEALGRPKRGVGRFALECGVPVVPIAVHGSERARSGWIVRPVKLRLRCGRPLTFPRLEKASPRLANEVTMRIWPCVELQYRWLQDLPALESKPPLVPRPRLALLGAGSDEERRAA